MKPHSLAPAASVGHTTRVVWITSKMVERRARDLAELKGRQACDVTAADLDQARCDLARKPESIS